MINDDVLAPISPERPAGDDLRASEDWVKLKAERPGDSDGRLQDLWTPLDAGKGSWAALRDLAATAIATKSKDLRIAIWFIEANVRLNQFEGLREGLHLIRELLSRFWDRGLYPLTEDDDLETRAGPLEWLNEKLADVLREIPLTRRSEPGDDYSLAYYHESRRPQGRISVSEFESAVRETSLDTFEESYRSLLEAESELDQLDALAAEKFGAHAPSFGESRGAIGEIRVLLERILRDRRPPAPASPAAPGARTTAAAPAAPPDLPVFDKSGGGASSWEHAEQLARSGKIDEALAAMADLAATEPTGRARFQRKLILVDICLKTARDQLAKVILEELATLIEKHQLETWETADVVGGVWARLYGCYSNENAGTADAERAAALFLKLCHLDPWRALKSSDGSATHA
jgi:type VI secretion system protein ImpA